MNLLVLKHVYCVMMVAAEPKSLQYRPFQSQNAALFYQNALGLLFLAQNCSLPQWAFEQFFHFADFDPPFLPFRIHAVKLHHSITSPVFPFQEYCRPLRIHLRAISIVRFPDYISLAPTTKAESSYQTYYCLTPHFCWSTDNLCFIAWLHISRQI